MSSGRSPDRAGVAQRSEPKEGCAALHKMDQTIHRCVLLSLRQRQIVAPEAGNGDLNRPVHRLCAVEIDIDEPVAVGAVARQTAIDPMVRSPGPGLNIGRQKADRCGRPDTGPGTAVEPKAEVVDFRGGDPIEPNRSIPGWPSGKGDQLNRVGTDRKNMVLYLAAAGPADRTVDRSDLNRIKGDAKAAVDGRRSHRPVVPAESGNRGFCFQ